MSVFEAVVYLVIAGLCGVIARSIAGTSGGFIVSVLVGFLGAFVGTWLARAFRLPVVLAVDIGGHPFPIVWSILGGALLVALLHFRGRRSSYGRWLPR